MIGAMRRLLLLSGWVIGLWFFFAVLTPRLLALSPAWQRYDAVQEEYGLDSGALYYSDLPISGEAEQVAREAVRRGMEERRRQARAEIAGNGEN